MKGDQMFALVSQILLENPPYGAKVSIQKKGVANGYLAKELHQDLHELFS